mmetsp:Transcript_89730/g.278944  ORF Transcript_89730/g.278944 Transcript_89730/m.278944 type:complete len:265 (+) Transcript_89730:1168-1962(+)
MQVLRPEGRPVPLQHHEVLARDLRDLDGCILEEGGCRGSPPTTARAAGLLAAAQQLSPSFNGVAVAPERRLAGRRTLILLAGCLEPFALLPTGIPSREPRDGPSREHTVACRGTAVELLVQRLHLPGCLRRGAKCRPPLSDLVRVQHGRPHRHGAGMLSAALGSRWHVAQQLLHHVEAVKSEKVALRRALGVCRHAWPARVENLARVHRQQGVILGRLLRDPCRFGMVSAERRCLPPCMGMQIEALLLFLSVFPHDEWRHVTRR